MPKITKPKLVNRGPAGLLSKAPLKNGTPQPEAIQFEVVAKRKNFIAEALQPLIVPIDSVKFDPENARLHPERNMQAIKDSLCLYGQVKPIVVREQTGVVMAGNGTLRAAKELGWTKIAATKVKMSHVEAAGYGLADNRSAELAAWNWEVVARLDKYCLEAKHASVGWSLDELQVLRITDWTAPDAPDNLEGQDPEEQETAPGDAELLMKLQVTIADPKTQVKNGEVYKLGQHLLVVADVIRESRLWRRFLKPPEGKQVLFAPYPGPMTPLTLAAAEPTSIILMVQPDPYVAGHILDYYKQINGDEEVSIA